VSITVGLFLILFREEPEFPPSFNSRKDAKGTNFTRVIEQLTANHDYLILLTIFAIIMGVFQTFGSLMGTIFEPFGLTGSRIALYGAMLLTSGIVVSPCVGSLVGKYKRYLLTMRSLLGCLAVTFWLTLFFIQDLENYYREFGLSMIICGACAVSLIPTCLDFAIETAFPVQPSIVTGLMGMTA
jgi:predicted MFS family arabinose efflux permease